MREWRRRGGGGGGGGGEKEEEEALALVDSFSIDVHL